MVGMFVSVVRTGIPSFASPPSTSEFVPPVVPVRVSKDVKVAPVPRIPLNVLAVAVSALVVSDLWRGSASR